MRTMEFRFSPIGIIHSPFKKVEDIDVGKFANPGGFDDVEGEIEIFREFETGLEDLEGFSHLFAICVFHKSEGYELRTKPFLDDRLRGVFSTRSPHRPNALGLTVLKILERKGRVVRVSGVDMIDGTPILDIKPYTTRDNKSSIRLGWLEGRMRRWRAEERS
jgi:tRNA-Thr(GGU) m(6)t(6)A37 methyltransferase TsaA